MANGGSEMIFLETWDENLLDETNYRPVFSRDLVRKLARGDGWRPRRKSGLKYDVRGLVMSYLHFCNTTFGSIGTSAAELDALGQRARALPGAVSINDLLSAMVFKLS